MPTEFVSKGKTKQYLDIKKEILEPKKLGYYSEVISRLDAYIDTLLDSLVRQIYGNAECQKLIDMLEKSLKKDYIYFSGLVKLELLNKTNIVNGQNKLIFPSPDLRGKIREFKRKRNLVLHSNIGYYNLINSNNYTSNKRYQKDAKQKVVELIKSGLDCYKELTEIMQDNADTLNSKK